MRGRDAYAPEWLAADSPDAASAVGSGSGRYWRMDAGYGFAVAGGRLVSVPGIGIGWADDVREVDLGWQLLPPRSHDFGVTLEATQRTSRGCSEHTVGIRLRMRW